MTQASLHFLFIKLKKPHLTKEQTESKICQEIFIAKLANCDNLSFKVAFKGGIVINSLSNGKRGYTKDIDFDLIKYPLSNESLITFFDDISKCSPYENITIKIKELKPLRHKNYKGKRANLSFEDGIDSFSLIVDIGVYTSLVKKNVLYEYKIAFGEKSKILINPVERMIAEKLSTFAIYGKDNTRDKDIFDAYFLLKSYSVDKRIIARMMKQLLVIKTHYYKTLDLAIASIINTINDENYKRIIRISKRNWETISVDELLVFINVFLKQLIMC